MGQPLGRDLLHVVEKWIGAEFFPWNLLFNADALVVKKTETRKAAMHTHSIILVDH